MNQLIRVLLVGGSKTTREEINHVLCSAEGITVIGEARNSEEALVETKRLSPDVILVLTDNDMSGIDTTRAINKAQLPAKVVIIAENLSQVLVPAIKAGVTGLLPSNVSPTELVEAIRRIYLWCCDDSTSCHNEKPGTTLFEI